MLENARFTVATHILTLLAYGKGQRMTSSEIAASVNTNPVVIRRVLGQLRRTGLVESRGGAGGGWLLARPPEDINLKDVLLATNPSLSFPMHPHEPNPNCPVGRSIQRVLAGHYEEAQRAMLAYFERVTIAELLQEVIEV